MGAIPPPSAAAFLSHPLARSPPHLISPLPLFPSRPPPSHPPSSPTPFPQVPTKEEVASAAGDDALWGAAWDPIGNALATIDAQGVPRAWRLPVPEGKTLPGDMSVLEADSPPVAIDAEAEEAGDGGAEEEDGDESSEDSMADFIDDAAGLFKGEGLKAKKRKKKGRSVKAGRQGMAWGRPQGPVQAGETPGKGDGKRRFLAYSLTGYVACLDNGDHQTLTATLHDSLARARPISHNDYNGICMAALCPDGMAWASRKEAPPGAQPAPAAFDGVGFISFDSWAKGRSEWSLPLAQGETPACVAAGGGFLAVATAQRTLRVISHGGVQIGVFSLDGDPVALCAAGDLLAVLFHSAFVARDGDQKLAFQVWNVATRAALYQGPVALSPRAAVTWVGFSEDEFLAVYDSEGVMRVRSHEMGGQVGPRAAGTMRAFRLVWRRSVDISRKRAVGVGADGEHVR